MKKIRRKPEFDRFHAGLNAYCEGIYKKILDPHDHDFDVQEFTNTLRGKLAHTWRYLIERLNKEEIENKSLRAQLAEAERVISWTARHFDTTTDADSVLDCAISMCRDYLEKYPKESK